MKHIPSTKTWLLIFTIILGLLTLACRFGTPTPTRPTSTVPLVTPTRIPTATPSEHNLNTPTPISLDSINPIRNGDFSQGLEFWDVQPSQECTACWMKALTDTSEEFGFLSWERTESGSSGAAIWANQALNLDVQTCKRLVLSFDLRVNNHSLPNSGWWSDQNHGSGEYPVTVRLKFLDTREQPFEWVHGFLAEHDGATRLKNYTLVSLGQWTKFEADLFSPQNWVDPLGVPLPAPILLADIAAGGNGWDFAGDIANLQLDGCPK